MINFKKAEIQDIELIRDLAAQSWQKAYLDIISVEQVEYMLAKMYSFEEIFSHLENPNYNYFLIENGSTCAGFIGFEFHYEEKTTKLHCIYLLAECKGKGLGKAAIQFLKNQSTVAGDEEIILNAFNLFGSIFLRRKISYHFLYPKMQQHQYPWNKAVLLGQNR
jgi:hypothetical protein